MSRAAAAFSFMVLTIASPCLAQEVDTRSASVGLQGLEIGSTAGDAILRARVRGAVRVVCGEADTRDLSAMADLHACRARAMQQGETLLQVARAQPVLVHSDSKLASSGLK